MEEKHGLNDTRVQETASPEASADIGGKPRPLAELDEEWKRALSLPNW